jgi:hypothetical protein
MVGDRKRPLGLKLEWMMMMMMMILRFDELNKEQAVQLCT